MRNAEVTWDRANLTADRAYWKPCQRPETQGVHMHLHAIKEGWCNLYNANEVEDSRHVMCWCDNPKYEEIRKWSYERAKRHTKTVSVLLEKVLEDEMQCLKGNLESPT